MESPLLNKSLEFATQIVLFYEEFAKSKRDTTIAKLHISLKEVSESIYWLTLLKNTRLLEYDYDNSIRLAEEIKKMLISSINTAQKIAIKYTFWSIIAVVII